MITVKFFEDITLYDFMVYEAGTSSDVLHTRVLINDVIYNYYQFKYAIIMNIQSLGTLHNVHSKISPINHLRFLDISKQNGIYHCVRMWNRNLEKGEYEFIDITRNLKLKKITNKLTNEKVR